MISASKKDVVEKLQQVPVFPCEITGFASISLMIWKSYFWENVFKLKKKQFLEGKQNEVQLVKKEMGQNFDIVYPASSILAESPVAVIDKVVDRKGIRKQATAYLQFLYTEPAQEVIAQHFFRPRSEAVLKKHNASFKPVKLFTVDEVFGGWDAAQKKHFDDGGEFDKIYQKK